LNDRLPAKVEAAAIMRRAESGGGFATIIRRGDPDRGTITLLVTQRGTIAGVLERQMASDFTYRWANLSADHPFDEAAWREFLEKKQRFDPDFWAIELDVADAERFIAETTVTG
jgi:hypothetical protein